MYLFERIFALRALIAAAMAGESVVRGNGRDGLRVGSPEVELGAAIFGVEVPVGPSLARHSLADDRFSERHVRLSAWSWRAIKSWAWVSEWRYSVRRA